MIKAIASFFTGMFSSSKLTDTAIDGIRKLGGLDEMNDKEKADFLLKYIEATKHQSLMRRFIAFAFVGGLMFYSFAWFVFTCLHRFGMGLGWSPAFNGQMDLLSDDMFNFMEVLLLQPVNLIIGFYFAVGLAKGFK